MVGPQPGRSERPLEPLTNDRRDFWRAEMAQKHKLGIGDRARDAYEHIVVLGKIFEKGLPAPEYGCTWTQPQLLACDGNRFRLNRLVIDRKIGQPYKLFRVIGLRFRRLHQIARQEIVECRQAACFRMAP